jgi:hypothetical protein
MRALLLTLRACIANGYVGIRSPLILGVVLPQVQGHACAGTRRGCGGRHGKRFPHREREGVGPGFAGGRVPPDWSRTRRPPCFLLWTHGTCGF